MNDRATFETANRLKAAGFPQPEPAPGQVWYSANGILFFLVSDVEGKLIFCSIHGANIGMASALNKCTYAPTAPDILRNFDGALYLIAGRECFEAYDDFRDLEDGTCKCMHLNPAEACAMAWLAQNER